LARAEVIKLRATADIWLSAFNERERNSSSGKVERFKLKSIQEMAAIRFDPRPILGREVLSARLFLHTTQPNNQLRYIRISTVNQDWVEGNSRRSYGPGDGATYNYADHADRKPWAWPGSQFCDVTFSSGHSLSSWAERREEGNGWISVDVDPKIVIAMATGDTDGMAVMDGGTYNPFNNFIHSRESGRYAPYLLVEVGLPIRVVPDQPTVHAGPDPDHADMQSGAVRLREFCQVWRPDVLDAHFIWPDGVGVALLANELKIPYIITLRGKIYECLPIPSQREQCATALQCASAVISVSGQLAEEARKLGISDDRLVIIPNGIDREYFHSRDKRTCRKELGLPDKGRLLVTVAHLGHRKGHHEVIRALAGLPDDVRLAIIGGPAQRGTPETLRTVAREVGVEDRLILPGHQPYEKIPMYFSAADASVLASYREGCPNAVLESLACGTPVVATDVGAVRDILPVPDVGRIMPPQEICPLRDALVEVLDRQWDTEQVVQASGVKSWDEVAREVQKALRKAVRNRQ
jgi:glycosyltransferase involved in cell wall biosynthesis